MEESIKRILPFADYCSGKGITDVETARKEHKPFRCIFKIRGVEYFSLDAYEAGIKEVFEKRREDLVKTGKRQTSEYSYNKRIVTSSPKWIEGKKTAIATVEQKLTTISDLDERFKVKQELKKLQGDLVRMEKAFAISQKILEKMLNDEDSEGTSN
jgi:hypothetical protein